MKMKKIFLILLVALILTGCKIDIPYIETTLTEEDVENKFYYNLLETEEEKLTYKEIYEGLNQRLDEFYVHGIDEELLNTIFNDIAYDYPEMFWYDADTEVTYEMYEDRGEEYTVVKPEYIYSLEEIANMQGEIESQTAECVVQCQGKESDYEKVKYIYEYMIDTVEYVDDASNDQNIYSALVSKESVCAGYAKSVQYLLEKTGVECYTITGEAEGEEGKTESHAWNIVECDGQYYYVDATWGDPEEEVSRLMTYDYLCCSEAELSKTHTADKKEEIPVCDSEELNYYRINDMFYENADANDFLDAMKESIKEKEDYTTFKFADKEEYETALKDMEDKLIDDALDYLINRYGLRESTCNYEYDDLCWKVNIFWSYE